MSNQELVSIREAARRLGVSDAAVRKAIKAGRVTLGPATDSGGPQLEWPKAREQYVNNSDTSRRSHVGSQGGARRKNDKPEVELPTSDRLDELPEVAGNAAAAGNAAGPKSGRGGQYNQARAAREVYQAKLAKLEYEQKIGKLVDADEVAAKWSKLITAAKTRILGIPAECKSRQADLPLAVIAVIDNVCREVLEDLANGRD